ncbi:MAG TPA: trigger factor [Actinomycetota bacterium]|nr:trigger factor [Actinomycetota bacterium]
MAPDLQISSERLDKDRVKMRVEAPEASLKPALDAVYRRWAGEIKVPGFRKGKVPRQLIDARVGPEVIREEALRDALPDLYREALAQEDLEAIAPPEIEVIEFDAGQPLLFEATVDVRPEVRVPDLSSISIEAPPSDVTDEELDEQLDRLRDRFAELEPVGREARRGDYVLVDLKGYRHEELVEGASAPDYLYEVGSRTGPPKLDEELEGTRPGAILKFNDTMPEGSDLAGEEISFTVLVKEVKVKKLPPLDDELAKTMGEFETLDELKDDLRERLGGIKRGMVLDEIANRAIAALVDASDLDPPEKLVESELEHRLEHFAEDVKRAGLTMDDYTRQAELTELEIRRDMRAQVERSVKAELLLEEIARTERFDVTEEDIGREIAVLAHRSGRDPKEVAEQVVNAGRLGSLAADIMRRKALEHVVQAINVAGRPTEEPLEEPADRLGDPPDQELEAHPS